MIRNQEKIDQVTGLYVAGLSTRQIAERTGISKSTVGSIIKQAALGRDRSTSQILGCRRRTRVPPDWSFLPLSAGKVRLLGLIYGDGTLSRLGDRIAITSGDFDVIDNINTLFGNALAYDVATSTYWRIRIHSKRLWQELRAQFGLTPHKSRTLPYPMLEDAMKPHFVRGLLDRDGVGSINIRQKYLGHGPVVGVMAPPISIRLVAGVARTEKRYVRENVCVGNCTEAAGL